MEGSIHESDLVLVDDAKEFPFSILKVGEVLFVIVELESDFNSTVIFEKFYFLTPALRTLLYLLKQVLAMQPHHLHRTQLYRHFSGLFIKHPI